MRYILATCFACAIGTPAALAAPGASISRDLATPGGHLRSGIGPETYRGEARQA
jgi:hypothetical protein